MPEPERFVLARDDFTAGFEPFWVQNFGNTIVGARCRQNCGDLELFSSLGTQQIYPLADTYFQAKLPTAPDPGTGTTLAILEAKISSAENLAMYVNAESINFSMVHSNVVDETAILYDPVEHAYWRIRVQEAEGSMVFWETSPDGVAWTVRREAVPTIDTSQLAEGLLSCGYYGVESALEPSYCEWDEFEIFGPHLPPQVFGGSAAEVTSTRALLDASFYPLGSPTVAGIEYGETEGYGAVAEETYDDDGVFVLEMQAQARDLKPSTTYHARAFAENEGGLVHGEDFTFTTGTGLILPDGITVADPQALRRLFVGSAIDDYVIEAAPTGVKEVLDPLGSGETVFELTVANEDVFPVTPTENPRAQMIGPDFLRRGDLFRFGGWFMLPLDFPENTPTVIIEGEELNGFLGLVSYYGEPFRGSGPWEIAAQGFPVANFNWQRNETYGFDIPWESPLVRGKWMRYDTQGLFDVDGWIQMWFDGVRQTFFAPGFSYNPNDEPTTQTLHMQTIDSSNNRLPNHAKISNYRRRDMFDSVTVYFKALEDERFQRSAVLLG